MTFTGQTQAEEDWLMDRDITLVGAPSSIGIRPYDSGEPRRLDLAPPTLRERDLISRLGAADDGDVLPGPYRDFTRTPGAVRNEPQLVEYSLAIADRVARIVSGRQFALVVGGDCSIVLGCTLGAGRAVDGPIGLAYIDGHADFATPNESRSGSAASMCLGLTTGRGETPLARLGGAHPLVDGRHVALVGRRDEREGWYGDDALPGAGVLDFPHAAAQSMTYEKVAAAVLERCAAPDLAGFWVHLDVDVLDPAIMPAVDSPEPAGPGLDEIADLLVPLVQHPKALGLELTIYDPALDDAERSCGKRLVNLLERVLAPVTSRRG
jgi:arginase